MKLLTFLRDGAERVGMMVIPIGGGNTHRQIQFFKDFGTTIIHITPSYALHVSDVIRDRGMSPDDFQLRVLIFGAEPYSEATRQKLERKAGYQTKEPPVTAGADTVPMWHGQNLFSEGRLSELLNDFNQACGFSATKSGLHATDVLGKPKKG